MQDRTQRKNERKNVGYILEEKRKVKHNKYIWRCWE